MGENAVVQGNGNYIGEETIIDEVFYNEVLQHSQVNGHTFKIY